MATSRTRRVWRFLIGHFFQWKSYPLTLGDRSTGGADWAGRIEAVAVYDRLLSAEEVSVNFDLLSAEFGESLGDI